MYGLSYEQNKKTITEIILNIILSLYFLSILDLGVAGILLGTIGSTILTCIWYEPYSIFKYGFKTSSKEYFKTMIQHFIVAGLSILCISLLELFVFTEMNFNLSIAVKIVLYLAMLCVYVFMFRNHEGGKQIILMIRKILFLKRLRRK